MSTLLLVAIVTLSVGLLFWSAFKSPMGYEDSTGFHYEVEGN